MVVKKYLSSFHTAAPVIIVFLLSSCNSASHNTPHLMITSEHLPLIKNPVSANRLLQLQDLDTLYSVRLKYSQLPPGYTSIVNLSISERNENNSTIPGVPPRVTDSSLSTTNIADPLRNLPQPIELRTTSPAPCLALIASPLNNQPTPIPPSLVKNISIGYFGPEFHQIHEELLLYPSEKASFNAFAGIIQSESSCKKFVITGADGGKSTAIFSRGASPKLGMRALSYVILNDMTSRLDDIQTSYVYLGPLLVHITASTPSIDAGDLKFRDIVKAAINNVIGPHS